MLNIQILAFASAAVADNACYACFNTTAEGAAKLTAVQALQFKQYWDPIQKTCNGEKNDNKRSLIFESKEAGIPKTWILNPKHCGSEPIPVNLAQAEKDWVLAQLSYSSAILEDRFTLQDCISEKYNSIADGSISTSQAAASQFTPIKNIGSIERATDYHAKSMKTPGQSVYAGPIGVFWADNSSDDELVLSWRGTATAPQLVKEIGSVVEDYLSPKESSFVDVKINDVHVGGAFDYFLSNFMDLWTDKAMDDFKKRAKTAKKIKVTAHSLGGAMASISAMYLVVEQGIPESKIQLVTFGEPRMSNAAFSVNLNTLIKNQQRYVYSQDLVPHGPPIKDIKGVMNPQGAESAFHHSAEIFLQKDFHTKGSLGFSKYHSCGYDDMKNEDGELCSNSVTNFGTITDAKHIIDTLKNDKQAALDHAHYWPQYAHFCTKPKTATTPNLII